MQWKTMCSLAVLMLAGSCTVQDRPARVSVELQGKPIGPPKACVSVSLGEELSVFGDGALGVRTRGTLWLNQTGRSCSSLRAMSTLIVERHGSEICRGDRVRALEPGSSIPGPPCVLGDFVPYRWDDEGVR